MPYLDVVGNPVNIYYISYLSWTNDNFEIQTTNFFSFLHINIKSWGMDMEVIVNQYRKFNKCLKEGHLFHCMCQKMHHIVPFIRVLTLSNKPMLI